MRFARRIAYWIVSLIILLVAALAAGAVLGIAEYGFLDVFPTLLGTLGGAVMLLAGLMLAAFVWWGTRKWRYYYPKLDFKVTAPPSDLSAAAVSLFDLSDSIFVDPAKGKNIEDKVREAAFPAMMNEMLHRGLIEPVEIKDEEDYFTPRRSSNRPWERRVLDSVDERGRLLEPDFDGLGDDLGQHLQSRGLFPENPVRKWRDTKLKRIVWASLGYLATAWVGYWSVFVLLESDIMQSPLGWVLVPSPILLMLIVILVTQAWSAPRVGKISPTPEGLEEIRRWRAFRKYLQSAATAKATDDIRDTFKSQFEAYLPYAMALGIGDAWIKQAAAVSKWPSDRTLKS